MKSFMVSLLGLVLSVSIGAEPLLKGRVWLASGSPAAGVHVRLFDLTDLRRSVGTTTDEAGYFALPLATVGRPTALPQGFALGQNYPNPFNPSTIIPYQLPDATHVRLEVFNLLGQRLATLVDGERPAGAHTAHWDATDATGRPVGAGVFIYRLSGGGHTVSRRMVLIDGQAGLPAGGSGSRPPAAGGVKTEGSVYGLTVAGTGLIAYVDPAFRVGTDPVDLVLAQPGGPARMKVATGGILGDVNNDSQVDEFDVLYVALYSKDPSITLPNNGDISLGDVNGDGTVDLADGLLLALYKVNPSDPTLPPGIGQPVDGGDDHGDSPSSATALAVGSSQSGQIEPGGDVDYFRVQVSESGELTVQTTGRLNTKGQLEDSAGAVLARNDDGGDGSNFRIVHAVSVGTYYTKVEGYDASTTGSYTIHASGPVGGPVNIPDANLRAVIAEALGKAPNAPITEGEMATLTSLEADEKGIRDLTGLEFATNLTWLGLRGNSLVDVSPLSGLTRLEYLWLDGNSLVDVSPLSGLTNLTWLGLRGNSLVDVSPLSGLTRLESLDLDGNSLVDVSPLSGLTRLESLDLDGNSLVDVSPLSGLTNLTWLGLRGNSLVDVSPLSGLTRLESLDLDGNSLVDVSPLSGLTRLESLDLDGNSLVDVSPLSGLTNLTWLGLRGNSLVDVSPLSGLTRLESLWLDGNSLVDVSPLSGLTNLTGLFLDTNSLADVSPLSGLTRLESLDLGGNSLVDVSPLSGLTNLRWLDLWGNSLADVSPLSGLTRLESLWLRGNNITDVSPLSGLTRLEAMDLWGNSLVDVSPLSGLTNLTWLDLRGNSLADVSPLSGLTRLESLDLGGNSLVDVSPLSGLTNLRTLYLAVNNIADVSPLSGLTRLERLSLHTNSIADVSPLAGLTRLERLSLDGNSLVDVSPLSGLTNLTWLDLESNIITDVSPLVSLTNLTWLDLRGNPLSVASINVHIAALVRRGVAVLFESFRQGDFDIELVFLDPFTEFQKRVVEYAARRWMSIIPEDLPDIEFARSVSGPCFDHSFTISRGERIDDLRIYVTFLPSDRSDPVVGVATPIFVRPSGHTSVGCMALNIAPRFSRTFRETALHEMGHIFGVGSLWDDFGFLQARYGDTHFNGPRAIAAFNYAGGRNYPGPKVPVQREVGAHWRDSVFQTELMVPYLTGRGWLSAITVQSLADLGYRVDVTQADPYTLPSAAQTSAAIASLDAWDDRLSEGLGLSTQVESKLQCGVGSGQAREPIYVVNEQGAIIRTLGD